MTVPESTIVPPIIVFVGGGVLSVGMDRFVAPTVISWSQTKKYGAASFFIKGVKVEANLEVVLCWPNSMKPEELACKMLGKQ